MKKIAHEVVMDGSKWLKAIEIDLGEPLNATEKKNSWFVVYSLWYREKMIATRQMNNFAEIEWDFDPPIYFRKDAVLTLVADQIEGREPKSAKLLFDDAN